MPTRLPSALPRRPTCLFSPSSSSSSSLNPLTTTVNATLTATPSHTPLSRTPSRAATLIKRPRRPYTFTQLVQLSDGSTYTMRTPSPVGMYRSTKDVRNSILWNPSSKSLRNIEVDEAGKLAAFRQRFGTSWDASTAAAEEVAEEAVAANAADASKEGGGEAKKEAEMAAKKKQLEQDSGDVLADLIAGYAVGMPELKHISPKSQKKK